nr:MAG TPA: hypothetical protein [Caudoviricetes sp.]
MLNHILGILIGYAATGCVYVYIDTAVQNAKTAKRTGRTPYVELPDFDLWARYEQTKSELRSTMNVCGFLRFMICWPFLIKNVHKKVKTKLEFIYGINV